MTQIIIDLNFYIYKKLKPLSFFAPHYIFFALMLSLVGIQGIIPVRAPDYVIACSQKF